MKEKKEWRNYLKQNKIIRKWFYSNSWRKKCREIYLNVSTPNKTK